MRTKVYRTVLFLCILIWIGGMYLAISAANDTKRGLAIAKSIAHVIQQAYFPFILFGFVILMIAVFVGPTLYGIIKQNKARNYLQKAGVRTIAEIVGITDTRVTINKNPRVLITVSFMDKQASFTATVSRVNIPRIGDRIPILYDPMDPTKVAPAAG